MNKKYKVKNTINHQNIGGKEINIEKILTFEDVEYEAFNNSNIACINFLKRRTNFNDILDKKLYYGHVGMYGYIVCEDELEEVV